MSKTADEFYMRRALGLAERAWGDTSPNPMVGAVLVKNGEIIGEGWHKRDGFPHAEIECLRSAKASPEMEPSHHITRLIPRPFLKKTKKIISNHLTLSKN